MISPFAAARAAVALGPRAVLNYAIYRAGLASGWLRSRTPQYAWKDIELPPGLHIRGDLLVTSRPSTWEEHPWSEEASRQAVTVGKDVLAGRPRLFGVRSPLDWGFPPPWDVMPPVGQAHQGLPIELDRHWTEVNLEALGGDVRLLWEPSRLTSAVDLARAYGWSGEQGYVEGFRQLLRSWMQSNPPNSGPHWASAQEAALRLLSVQFAFEVLAPELKAEDEQDVARFMIAHARRIPPTMSYSRAQGNNHMISEAVALIAASLALPDWPQARQWGELGRGQLKRGLQRQIWEDGGYVQHSHNYARLTLALGLWAVKLDGRGAMGEALGRLAQLLRAVGDQDGRLPNFGPNDGAWLLPLTACPYADFRPTLQLAAAMLGCATSFPPGPWDELALWFGAQSKTGAREPEVAALADTDFPRAGLFLLQSKESKACVRAANFSSRPGHSDQLHIDLWWRGRNLAGDPGTYLYGGEPPWENGLSSAIVHNGLLVGGLDPMERAGRFLWLHWSHAKLLWRSQSADHEIEAAAFSHDGYHALGLQQRRLVVRAGGGLWLIQDTLLGSGEYDLTLGWLLPDAPWRCDGDRLTVSLDEGSVLLQVEMRGASNSLIRAGEPVHGEPLTDDLSLWGWSSPTYGLREPALHWLSQAESAAVPLQVRSWWACGPVSWRDVEMEWDEVGQGPSRLAAVRAGASELVL